MFALRYFLLEPMLVYFGLSAQMSVLSFSLLVVATVLLAAAGYITNDVQDVDADNVNKPDKVIVGKYIKVKTAENLHLFLNALAIALGIYISRIIGINSVALAFIVVAGLLYFYSTTYKGQLVLGNIMVSLFAALVPAMVLLFEMPLLKQKYKAFESVGQFNFNFLIAWFGYYALFAFLTTLVREIIKDMEDFEGDTAYGQKTLPVVYGIKVAKIIAVSLSYITFGFVVYLTVAYLNNLFSVIYIVPFILAPLFYIGYTIITAKEKKDYSNASKWCKILMVAGILYVVLVKTIFLSAIPI